LPKKADDISDIMRDIKSYTQKLVFGYLKQNNDILKFKFICGKDCFCQPFLNHRGAEIAATRENKIIYKINNSQVINSSRVEQVSVPARSEASPREYNNKDILNLLKIGKLWQRGFYDHLIRNERDFREKLNYINYNAVKHGLVKDPKDWKYSSFCNYEFNDHSIIKINRLDL